MTDSESLRGKDEHKAAKAALTGSRPHPLDQDAEEWDKPKSRILTTRNVIGALATLFVSLMLGLHSFYYHSPGAAVGVFFATAILFGPLWFTLAHQSYEDRFQRWNRSSTKQDAPAAPTIVDASIEPEYVAVPVVTQIAAVASVGAAKPAGTNDTAESQPEVASFYTPLDARRTVDDRRLSPLSNGLVVIFGFYVAAMLIAAPFLTAVILSAWG